ncbi:MULTISPECIES: hypothetical protein [Pseudomonas]|uniref:Apea-like HEPN domain-containing protein n=2 Tax=Pseudomonas syringae group TaxID=136849 RepID=A0A3M4JBF8_PSEVI|nr:MULTISPECIES: hypothetical protein [Pseudomonas]KTB75303.1 hypothetical protein AO068_00995 [Pseudomonas sp. ICMP 3272]KTC55196.1 hypothetical protein AO258_01000 [Pseudomonas syringae ICMP 19498]RMP09578.1 hypothetical protein ALQ30_02834 [Pseudomonas syringae pv. persicae]RMQ14005.1 hypothetical protein ALQ09_02116 [Pseudomonas viridiflava]RMQ69132.1 hypothetical protein ALP98_01593 [Pseudomonas viridiflava]
MRSKFSNEAYASELLNKIFQNCTLNPNGTISYRIENQFYHDALYGLIKHNHKLDDDTVFAILVRTLEACFIRNQHSKSSNILTELDKACNLKTKSQSTYILITEVSILNIYKMPKLKINDCHITFHNELPLKYKKHRDFYITEATEHKLFAVENYTFACITISAASEDHAVNSALEALGAVRAILQIGFKKNRQLLSSSKEDEYPTASVVQCGRVHTLHMPSGEMTGTHSWINSSFKGKPAVRLRHPEKTTEHLKRTNRRLRSSAYSAHTLSALANYIDSTDREDAEMKFMKLWSTLEILTLTDKSEILIRRASFFYQDRILHQALLESLRDARNTHVHRGHPPVNIEQKNFQLCAFVENILNFFIVNPFKFSTVTEINNLLSLPTQETNLKTQIMMLKTVQRFISYPNS